MIDESPQKVLFVLPDGIDMDQCVICSLWHSQTGLARYLVHKGERFMLMEIQCMKMNGYYNSWFLDQEVVSDGSLFFATEIDPLFFFLHLFEKHGKKYNNLQDILTEESKENNDYHLLRGAETVDFSAICNVQEILEKKYWKLDEGKAKTWLQSKFDTIRAKLVSMDYKEPSTISSFVKVMEGEDQNEKMSRNALGFLSEYLDESWTLKMREVLKLPDTALEGKTMANTMDDVFRYSQRRSNDLGDNEFAFASKPAATKSSKIDKKGIKSISSFFSKKE